MSERFTLAPPSANWLTQDRCHIIDSNKETSSSSIIACAELAKGAAAFDISVSKIARRRGDMHNESGKTVRGKRRMTLVEKLLLIVFTVGQMIGTTAASVVVFDQSPPGDFNADTATSSTLDNVGGTPGYRTADNFMVAQAETITDVHWWGRQGDSVPAFIDNFTFTFYADNAGTPGSVLLTTSGSLTTSLIPASFGVNYYSSDLSDAFSASASTTYWISIFDSAVGASWTWLGADNSGDGAVQGVEGGGFPTTKNRDDRAFQLTAVPEPATLALLALGLAGLGFSRRKQ